MTPKETVWYLVVWMFALFALAIAADSRAGEIRLHNTDPTKFAYVGEVTEGDAQMLRNFLVDNQEVTEMVLFSGGGLVGEGIEMMEIIYLRGLNTKIVDLGGCYSICSFMWLGGIERTVEGSGSLGVHLPFMPAEVVVEFTQTEHTNEIAKTLAWKMWYVESLGIEVDQYFWMMILVTPPTDMHVFTREELNYLEVTGE